MDRFGAPCDTALSGKEAIALFEQNGNYNLIFIDWKMPVMDGLELSRELKKRMPKKSEAILVLMSAGDGSAIADDAREAGVSKFFQKPLFPSTIEGTVYEYLLTATKADKESSMVSEGITFKGCRILLAEDIDINREIVLALLEPTLVEVDCVINGREAVQRFSEAPERYDLIFMDVQMPEMDGLTATERIRALDTERAKTIPIIAMTANVFKEDVEKCLAAGMNDHLGKPIDFKEVLETLQAYLS
jgi:CheY-like chemotaxis protein